jgi:multidrug resistance efflux pump
MVIGLLILIGYLALVWLIFFRLRLLKFNAVWGIVSALVGVHLLLIFLIGIRFGAPSSNTAQVVQYTIQLIPRLSEPTLVTEVLVAEGDHVTKGQKLFQFDRTVYEAKVHQLEAELAEAKQNVKVLEANVALAAEQENAARAELAFSQYRRGEVTTLLEETFSTQLEVERWDNQVRKDQADVDAAGANIKRAMLEFQANVDGVNPKVAALQAELMQAQYYLDNTTMVAPEDGRIVNLQVRPGMVSGILRVGGIAAFIVDADPYVLATYYQPQLKYIATGLPVEVALDAYPGQIFKGVVDAIWKTNAQGQYLPSDVLPTFGEEDPHSPRGQFAVKVRLTDLPPDRLSIGTHGVAAIYTGNGGFVALRRIVIRSYTWFNWLYPLNV